MTDRNGFYAYESAIIGGLLASGEWGLPAIQNNMRNIRATARKFSGSVADVYYPVGVHWAEADAAEQCLLSFMTEPRYLARALDHLVNLGFSEQVSRYAYSKAIDSEWLNIEVVDGAPMLMRIEEVSV